MSYGNCPKCGAKGIMRERRPNGNDKCEKGHTYPSKDAILEERRCDLCQHEKDLPCIGKVCNSVNGLAGFVPKGAESEKHSADLDSELTLDQWKISWKDIDHVQIEGPHNQVCVMAGGDFESLLSALCGAYNRG